MKHKKAKTMTAIEYDDLCVWCKNNGFSEQPKYAKNLCKEKNVIFDFVKIDTERNRNIYITSTQSSYLKNNTSFFFIEAKIVYYNQVRKGTFDTMAIVRFIESTNDLIEFISNKTLLQDISTQLDI